MEFLVEVVGPVLLVGTSFAAGYFCRPARESVERVRVQYIDKPTVVEKVRVERVEVPVTTETIREVVQIVEKPVLQIERVEVPHVVEKVVEHHTVSVERVEVPVIVKELQVERVEVERVVIVEKPVIQIERVDVERIVEKPVITVQRVPMSPMEKAPDVEATMVEVVFMDSDEKKVKFSEVIDSKLRRATVVRDGVKFSCARQDADSRYIYRQVAH